MGNRVTNLSILGKLCNISELTSQQSFPKFMEIQGVTQLLFYMLLIKLKCLNGKEKLRLLNTIGVLCKVWDTTVKMLKRLCKLFATLGEKKRVLLKQACDCINKWKQKLLSLNHQKKRRCCKLVKFYSSRVNEIIISDFFLIMVGLSTKNKEARLLWFTGLISFLHFHSS